MRSNTPQAEGPEDRVPEIPEALLKHMEGVFPDRAPPLAATLDLVRYKTGQVSVTQWMRNQFNRQNDIDQDI